ncbi:MAG: hypothetical protein V4850_14815 [Myxococcota bacterium]
MPTIFLLAVTAMGLGAELGAPFAAVRLPGDSPPLGFLDPGGWLAEGGLVTIPDAMGAEAQLTHYEVDAGQASVVSASVHDSIDERPRVWIHRVALGHGGVTSSTELRGMASCTNVGDVDWTSGEGLRVEATGLGTTDPSSASVVLVEGNPRIGALVMLVPGDTAEVREVRRGGHLLRESLTVRHGEDVMALRREGRRREVCHVRGASDLHVQPIVEVSGSAVHP